jgi:hypothetical protein
MDRGNPVHLEASDDDASAGINFTMYRSGSTTAITLGAGQYLTITDVVFISTAGGVYTLAFDALLSGSHAADAGTWIAKGNADAVGGLAHHFETPRTGPKGVMPRLLAAAGQVDVVLTGYIQET